MRQETSTAEQGPADQSEGKKGKIKAVEAGMAGLERMKGYCLDVQGWSQES